LRNRTYNSPPAPERDSTAFGCFFVVIFLIFTSVGGTTKFYETDPLQKVSGDTEALLQVAPKVNLIPKTGTLVIFNHDALHEGTPTPSFLYFLNESTRKTRATC
jgi:hypothetical protein